MATKQIPFEQRLTCRLSEAVSYSGMGRSKLCEMIADGRVESKKVDGTRLILVKPFLRLLGCDDVNPQDRRQRGRRAESPPRQLETA